MGFPEYTNYSDGVKLIFSFRIIKDYSKNLLEFLMNFKSYYFTNNFFYFSQFKGTIDHILYSKQSGIRLLSLLKIQS